MCIVSLPDKDHNKLQQRLALLFSSTTSALLLSADSWAQMGFKRKFVPTGYTFMAWVICSDHRQNTTCALAVNTLPWHSAEPKQTINCAGNGWYIQWFIVNSVPSQSALEFPGNGTTNLSALPLFFWSAEQLISSSVGSLLSYSRCFVF